MNSYFIERKISYILTVLCFQLITNGNPDKLLSCTNSWKYSLRTFILFYCWYKYETISMSFVWSRIMVTLVICLLIIKAQHHQVLKSCTYIYNEGTLMYLYTHLTQALNLGRYLVNRWEAQHLPWGFKKPWINSVACLNILISITIFLSLWIPIWYKLVLKYCVQQLY